MKPINNELSPSNILRIRATLGLTQSQFGKLIGKKVGAGLVSRWELGRTKPTNQELVINLRRLRLRANKILAET